MSCRWRAEFFSLERTSRILILRNPLYGFYLRIGEQKDHGLILQSCLQHYILDVVPPVVNRISFTDFNLETVVLSDVR